MITSRKQQQRNPRSSLIPVLRRTTNHLHHESDVFESPSPMVVSTVTEETKVTSPDIESSIKSAEILDCDLLVSPTTDELQNPFADDSTLSDSSQVLNVSPTKSTKLDAISSDVNKETETMNLEDVEMVKLLQRSGIDSNQLKSLIKIGQTNLQDDTNKLMCLKMRIGIYYFVMVDFAYGDLFLEIKLIRSIIVDISNSSSNLMV
ncbi:hypothetical protein MKX01_004076 [Papaver californicum]|nr:hypothetical protein MKX01_004076 [Papaver californicum]